jgi:CTP synthase (UTP-ammonia lyase)
VLGIADADTAENNSGSQHIVITPVACAVPYQAPGAPKLSGGGTIHIEPGSLLASIYGGPEAYEEFFCNYEVNPEYETKLQAAGLRVTARGSQGEIRAVELPGCRFFLATLFQPQLSSSEEHPHSVFTAFLNAVRANALKAKDVAGRAPT